MPDRSLRSGLKGKWRQLALGAVVLAVLTPLVGILGAPQGARAEGDKPAAPEYLGTAACTAKCHKKELAQHQASIHSKTDRDASAGADKQGCEACHGPAGLHKKAVDNDDENLQMQKPATLSSKQMVQICSKCHATTVSALKFEETEHAADGMTCRDCHSMHQDKQTDRKLKLPANELCLSCHQSLKVQFKANAHHPVLEGRLDCIDCHNPHGGSDPGMLKKDIDQLCTSCHKEKQGPFVYEHSPNVDEMEDGCLTCHAPHGTPAAKLVKLSGRGLCLQCHTDIATDGRHRARPGSCWRSGCHVRLHGSQTDPLLRR